MPISPIFALALAVQATLPAEWSEFSDTTPQGIERSAGEVCGRRRQCLAEQDAALEQLVTDWTHAPDERHRTLILLSIENHSRPATNWTGALADYRNRATAVAMEGRVMRQLEQQAARARAEAVNREIRRENGTSRVVTTCHTTGSGFYPSATTRCTTREE